MRMDKLTYEADGLQMESWLYIEEAGAAKRPGVLVFPEAFGLGEHARGRAERLARLGYVALACDLHGEGRLMQMEEVMPVIGALRQHPDRVRARARGGLQALLATPEVDPTRIAAIGYCFGGTMSLELARSGAAVAGVVSFHGGLETGAPAEKGSVQGKVLVCTGADDPVVPLEQRQAFEAEMRAAGVNWQLNAYGGVVHSFTNPAADAFNQPDFIRYDAQADARSWSEMRTFFDEIFVA